MAKRTEKRDEEYQKDMQKKRIDKRIEDTLAWANDLIDDRVETEDTDRIARRTCKVLDRRDKSRSQQIQKVLGQKYPEKVDMHVLSFVQGYVNEVYEKLHEIEAMYMQNNMQKTSAFMNLNSFYLYISVMPHQICQTRQLMSSVLLDVKDDNSLTIEEKCDLCTLLETLYQHTLRILRRAEKKIKDFPAIAANAKPM